MLFLFFCCVSDVNVSLLYGSATAATAIILRKRRGARRPSAPTRRPRGSRVGSAQRGTGQRQRVSRPVPHA